MISKTFILNDESLNAYGFRILTDGINIGGFKKNPVMLYMHFGFMPGLTNEFNVIGRWENIRKEGNLLLADAFFNLANPIAQVVFSKVVNNNIKLASIGIRPIENSSKHDLLVKGQRYKTVTRSIAFEASFLECENDNAMSLHDMQTAQSDNSDKLIKFFKQNDLFKDEIKYVEYCNESNLVQHLTGDPFIYVVNSFNHNSNMITDFKMLWHQRQAISAIQ